MRCVTGPLLDIANMPNFHYVYCRHLKIKKLTKMQTSLSDSRYELNATNQKVFLPINIHRAHDHVIMVLEIVILSLC